MTLGRKSVLLPVLSIALAGCSGLGKTDNQTAVTSKPTVTTSARPGYKLVEFCEAYVLEVPQTADSHHAADQCILVIRLPNQVGELRVRMVDTDSEIHDFKYELQNPQVAKPQEISVNGIMFKKTQVTGTGVEHNAPMVGCLLVSVDEVSLESAPATVKGGYRIEMRYGPDNASTCSDLTNIAMSLRKK